jgi:uncharacterized protein involved in type VI secretion and phage assembly
MSILREKFDITIDGAKVGEEDGAFGDYDVSNVKLVQELQKPNELRFLMNKKSTAENENDIRIAVAEDLLGKPVELNIKTNRDDKEGKKHDDILEFTGIIFSVNALRKNYRAVTVIEIIAYSPDYLLIDNPHCFSYEDCTLKEIVTETLKPYDITSKIDPIMGDTIHYTVQYNENNYDFIKRLSHRFGEWLYYDGSTFVFGKVKKEDELELLLGYEVLSYQYCLDMEHLNYSHAHHEYLAYENYKSDPYADTGDDMHNLTDLVYKSSKSAYEKETFQHLKASVPEENDFGEPDYSSKNQGLGEKAKLMVCHGTTNRADLKIGTTIKIKECYENENNNLNYCYHDELLIYKVTHYTDKNGNDYENEFIGVPASCEYPPYSYGDYFPHAGSQRAVVMDNKDPEQLGRIRVQFLWQKEQDENLMTPWIRIAQPHGGDKKGFYFIPEIGEDVMVAFENGNAEKPYVTGTLYCGGQYPDTNWYDDTNKIKALRTKNGHTIEIHDEGEGGFIKIYDNEKNNYILTLSTDEKLIKLQSTGNIELHADNDVIINANNNVKIKAKMDMTLGAGGKIDENAGSDLNLGAGGDMAISAGNNMDRKTGANETLYVAGNKTVEIKGSKSEEIAGKYWLYPAGDTDIISDATIHLEADKIEIKGDSSIKNDGGPLLDLFAGKIRIN